MAKGNLSLCSSFLYAMELRGAPSTCLVIRAIFFFLPCVPPSPTPHFTQIVHASRFVAACRPCDHRACAQVQHLLGPTRCAGGASPGNACTSSCQLPPIDARACRARHPEPCVSAELPEGVCSRRARMRLYVPCHVNYIVWTEEPACFGTRWFVGFSTFPLDTHSIGVTRCKCSS